MKRILAIPTLLLAAASAAAWAQSPPALKVGVFDANRVSEETDEGKRIAAKLSAFGDKKKAELMTKEKEIADCGSQLESQTLSLSPEKQRSSRRTSRRRGWSCSRRRRARGTSSRSRSARRRTSSRSSSSASSTSSVATRGSRSCSSGRPGRRLRRGVDRRHHGDRGQVQPDGEAAADAAAKPAAPTPCAPSPSLVRRRRRAR
jgi:Skp family chaperone for outer membrane proteins